MATDIKLPPLSENVTEGGVLEIRVKAGDAVEAGDVIAVIEAEKSTLEITSDQTGKVSDVLVKKGDIVKVGQPLIRVDTGAAASPTDKPAKSEKPAKAEKHAEKPTNQAEPDLVGRIKALTEGRGVSCALECSGRLSSQRLCIEVTRRRGRVAFVGDHLSGPSRVSGSVPAHARNSSRLCEPSRRV